MKEGEGGIEKAREGEKGGEGGERVRVSESESERPAARTPR